MATVIKKTSKILGSDSADPELQALLKAGRAAVTPAAWQRFRKRYRAEMRRADASRVLDLLATLSHTTDFSVGCYCEDESRCHRSVLRELLQARGAVLSSPVPG